MGKLFSIEPLHESRQVPAREHPPEGGGDLLVAILEPKQAIFEFAERGLTSLLTGRCASGGPVQQAGSTKTFLLL